MPFGRFEIVVRLSCDKDGVPGPYNDPESWLFFALNEFMRARSYNTEAAVVSATLNGQPIRVNDMAFDSGPIVKGVEKLPDSMRIIPDPSAGSTLVVEDVSYHEDTMYASENDWGADERELTPNNGLPRTMEPMPVGEFSADDLRAAFADVRNNLPDFFVYNSDNEWIIVDNVTFCGMNEHAEDFEVKVNLRDTKIVRFDKIGEEYFFFHDLLSAEKCRYACGEALRGRLANV